MRVGEGPAVALGGRKPPLSLGAAIILLSFVSMGCLHRRSRSSAVHKGSPPGSPSAGARSRAGGSIPAALVVQGEEGIASWYGHPYHGRRAASGETYNMYQMTAAHRTLPFGTEVRVRNLDNGSDATVRINDRGPFVEGRIIDLSYAAARAIGMVGLGMAHVRLEIINPDFVSGPNAMPGLFAVQVGAFRERANAERLSEKIAAEFNPVTIETFDRGDGLLHRVRVGHEATQEAARALAHNLRSADVATETFVVRLN